MKVGINITVHNSEINTNGYSDLQSCVDSFCENIQSDYFINIIDNQSTGDTPDLINKKNIQYTYIKDQDENGGLTGAWNLGVKMCYQNNCDVILNSNEDVEFLESINYFVNYIFSFEDKQNSIFGPISNRSGLSTTHQARERDQEKNYIIETTNNYSSHGGQGYALNGFFLGFSKEFYEKFNVNGDIFSTNRRDMWGGQEVELFDRNTPAGMRSFILENCYIQHNKNRSWKKRSES